MIGGVVVACTERTVDDTTVDLLKATNTKAAGLGWDIATNAPMTTSVVDASKVLGCWTSVVP